MPQLPAHSPGELALGWKGGGALLVPCSQLHLSVGSGLLERGQGLSAEGPPH